MKIKNILISIPVFVALVLISIALIKQGKRYLAWQNGVTEDTLEYKKKKKKKRYKKIYAKQESPVEIGSYWRMLTTPDDVKNPEYPNGYLEEARRQLNVQNRNSRRAAIEFVERGPANAPGRTRSFLALPGTGSAKRWLAASVSGGIWESVNEGDSWTHKTQDINSLSVSTMTASTDGNTIYAGTGEYFGGLINGSGVLKSTNGGRTWSFLSYTENNDKFSNVNEIICHPSNPNLVLAATSSRIEAYEESGNIMYSSNGGQSWKALLSKNTSINDIIVSSDFNKIYATDGKGLFYKSTNRGQTWRNTINFKSARIEIAMSNTNENVIYAQLTNPSEIKEKEEYPFIWVSYDGGDVFYSAKQSDENVVRENYINYLGNQGYWDNAIMVHPFDENAIYHGGVSLFYSTVNKIDTRSYRYVVYQTPTPFINFISHKNIIANEEVQVGESINQNNIKSFEFRFGNKSQKAHRFTVENRGAGVADADYIYNDYVDIPFEVWDTENNKKLMVSFRDQNDNSKWDLTHLNVSISTPEQLQSREYLYIHDLEYSNTPNSEVAKKGGITFKRMCFIWPTLMSDLRYFDATVTRTVTYNKTKRYKITITSKDVADSYGGRSRINSFNPGGANSVHPDHHHLSAIIQGSSREWRLITGNDGGIYITKPAEIPGIKDNDFTYKGDTYNTTQFYSVDKHPTENRYVGGSQDNGTWMTPENTTVDKRTKYDLIYGGDGFETIWHSADQNKLLVSYQRYNLAVSKDGGESFNNLTSLPNRGSDRYPFYTQVGNTKSDPDLLVTMSQDGIHVSNDFGDSWSTERPAGFQYNKNSKLSVSHADPSYIWAGGGFGLYHSTFLSTNKGESFTKITPYSSVALGATTGIYAHPLNKETAYMLFSFYSRPKVLRTTNAGQSWEDISGFEGESSTSVSSRKFPNVKVYSLLVFPLDGKIWVSTELGIVESSDHGQSWHKLDSNLPNVPIYQMRLGGNQVILATHGRGIWTYTNTYNYVVAQPPIINKVGITPNNQYILDVNTRIDYDKLKFYINDNLVHTENNVKAKDNRITTIPNWAVRNETASIKLIAEKQDVNMTSNIITFNAKPIDTAQITNYRSSLGNENDWLLNNMTYGSDRLIQGFNTIETTHPIPDDYTGSALLLKKFVVDPETPTVNIGHISLLKNLARIDTATPNKSLFAQLEYSHDGLNWQAVQRDYNLSATSSNIGTYRSGDIVPRVRYPDTTQLSLENIERNKPFLLRFHIKNSESENTYPWGFALASIYVQNKITGASDNIFESKSIKIYPNPASKTVNIYVNDELPLSSTVKINDINGNEKYRAIIESEKIENNIFTLNLPYLDSGVYILVITKEFSIIYSNKLVIKH